MIEFRASSERAFRSNLPHGIVVTYSIHFSLHFFLSPPRLFLKSTRERREVGKKKCISFNSGNNGTLINSTCKYNDIIGLLLVVAAEAGDSETSASFDFAGGLFFYSRVLLYSVSGCVCVPPEAAKKKEQSHRPCVIYQETYVPVEATYTNHEKSNRVEG